MSVVSLLGVKVLNNPAPFSAPYEFEITFECLEQLREDLEWKLTYVGSATSSEHDQELDSLLVGPIPVGVNKFIFEADPPSLARLPSSEILGVTVILLTCSYASREFVRVGYYVNNEYDSEELNAEPPAKPIIERVKRNVLAEKPRVTRFAIKWDSDESAPAEYPPAQPEVDTLDDDGVTYGAEEAELQAALELELADTEAKLANEKAEVATASTASTKKKTAPTADGDAEMAGMDQPASNVNKGGEDENDDDEDDEGDGSEAGSEDLEAESSGSEDEDEEDNEAEGEGEIEGGTGNSGAGAGVGNTTGQVIDEDMEMADGDADGKSANEDAAQTRKAMQSSSSSTTAATQLQDQPGVMVH